MPKTMEKENKNITIVRAFVVCSVVFAVALLIFFKILYIQLVRGDKYRGVAEKIEYSTRKVPSYRGTIFSDDGRALVSYKPMYSVSFDPTVCKDDVFEKNIKALCDSLARFPRRMSAAEYERQIRSKRREGSPSFMISPGGKEFDYVQLARLKRYPIFNLGQANGGLVPTTTLRRDYPYGQLLHRTLGESDSDRGRLLGLEDVYDSVLRGTDGVQVYRNLKTESVPIYSSENRESVDGCDVYTTIDIDIQDIADKALREKLVETNAENGCVIVMDVETGHIKAMVNLGFENGQYVENFNYAVAKRMEPGSTMKLASFMALMEKGHMPDLDRKYDLKYVATPNSRKKQSRRVGGYMATDDHALGENGNGKTTVREILEQSSNVGTACLVWDAFSKNPDKYIDQLYAMSMTEKHSLGFKGEKSPWIKHPSDKRNWDGKSLQTISFGYAIEFTPLQILAFYNAVANNGKMMKPLLVSKIMKDDVLIESFDTVVLNPEIASATTIAKAKELLEGVVKNGTAKSISTERGCTVAIAGKTGTAQLYNEAAKSYKWYNPKTGQMDKRYYNSTFVGYFPADKPKYSCIVIVGKPNAVVYGGGGVCAPVFSTIAQSIYSTSLGVKVEQYGETAKRDVKLDGSTMAYNKVCEYCETYGIKLANRKIDSEWVKARRLDNGVVDFKEVRSEDGVVPNVKA